MSSPSAILEEVTSLLSKYGTVHTSRGTGVIWVWVDAPVSAEDHEYLCYEGPGLGCHADTSRYYIILD